MIHKAYTTLDDFPEWELEAYADGAALPHVAAFTQQHPAQWQAWVRQNQLPEPVAALLFRFDCPSLEELRSYYWQEIAPAQRGALERHLQLCPDCADELQLLQSCMAQSDPVLRPHASPQLTPQPTLWARLTDFLGQTRLILAELVPNTPQLATVALRSAAPVSLEPHVAESTWLFATDEADVTLIIQRNAAAATLTINGQIFAAPTETPPTFVLVAANPAVAPQQGAVDEVGTFIIEPVPPGHYQLAIKLGDHALVLPELTLT